MSTFNDDDRITLTDRGRAVLAEARSSQTDRENNDDRRA